MKRLRALRMALQTISGLGRRGFFIPYRYADSVARPPDAPGYPAVATLFQAAEASFQDVLTDLRRARPALIAFSGPAPEPRWDQTWFPRLDGAAAYAIASSRRPRRIIEVGSGHSTRFLARAARDSGAATRILCIDPAPRATLPAGVEHRAEILSIEHTDLFAGLAPGDIAFFDSSHILHPHTDVDLMLNHIFPALRPGVLIHVHDIFLPDPYPADWGWRGYAEQSGVAPWLLAGGARPIFSSRWALTRMADAAAHALSGIPLPDGAVESSLWIEKLAPAVSPASP